MLSQQVYVMGKLLSDWSCELPHFGGRLRTVAPSPEVSDSRWTYRLPQDSVAGYLPEGMPFPPARRSGKHRGSLEKSRSVARRTRR